MPLATADAGATTTAADCGLALMGTAGIFGVAWVADEKLLTEFSPAGVAVDERWRELESSLLVWLARAAVPCRASAISESGGSVAAASAGTAHSVALDGEVVTTDRSDATAEAEILWRRALAAPEPRSARATPADTDREEAPAELADAELADAELAGAVASLATAPSAAATPAPANVAQHTPAPRAPAPNHAYGVR